MMIVTAIAPIIAPSLGALGTECFMNGMSFLPGADVRWAHLSGYVYISF